MRFKSLIFCSSSIAALGLASPAWAQDQGTSQPPQQESVTTSADQPADPETEVQEEVDVVVTGIRASLRSAQNIKQQAQQVVDAVVAEDIGKLPDIAVSDTAARIPGVQVERGGGEANRVLLRGLDRDFYTTTYNGREIFTAETRSVALQDFPAGGIAAVEAFKTSTANLVEPGLAGLINVRSRRPFDFSGFEIAGSVWGNYPIQSDDPMPNAQLLVTNRWDVGAGEIGALINFSFTRMHYQDSVRRHGFFIAGLPGGRSPDWPQIQYFEGDRWRPSINGALQWRPSDTFELYFEGLWQGYRERVSDRLFEQPLWSCGGAATYSNIVVENGAVVSGTVTNPGCVGTARGFQGATKRHTDTFQFAGGGRYESGPLLVTFDLARTDSTFTLMAESVDYYINNNNYSVNWYTGPVGGSGPTFEVVGLDFANPANYNYRGFFERYLTAKGSDWQGRVDLQYEPAGLDWLPKIEGGLRYVDRTASRVDGERYWDANDVGRFQIPITSVPLDYRLFSPAFRGDGNRPTPTTWLAPTFDSLWSNLIALRQFNITRGLPLDPNPTRSQNNDTNPPVPVPARNFDINERTMAGYGQLNYDFMAGSVSIGGLLGLRVVHTQSDISGTRLQPGNPPEPITVSNEDTHLLPNLNINIGINEQVQLRLAATRTISRPLFEQLNPALNVGPPPACNPALVDCVLTGSGGNPFLEPLQSTNFDASLEYYFSRAGFASIAVFRRDMEGFIVNRTFTYPTPDPDTGLPLLITGPVNTNEGRIQGFEAQISTFFDWDWVPRWARGFGMQANATYIDAQITLPLFCPANAAVCAPGPGQANATTIRTPIPDVSEWTFNLVAMYEQGPISARLSYNHRSSYPEGPLAERDGFFTLQGRGRPHGRLDWSSSFNVNENFTLFFDWINILNNPFKSDIVRVNYANGVGGAPEIFPMVVRYNESVLSGGFRFRF